MIRLVLILVLLGLFIYVIWFLLIRSKPSESALYAELVSQCLGDYSQADRLIHFERTRGPNANLDRSELIARALRRLERDKHR